MNKVFRNYILLALFIALGSEIHFYPFNTLFRVSLGIIILNVVGLVREDIDPLPLSLLTGLVIFIERLFSSMVLSGIPYEQAFLNGIPSLGYYFAFGFLFKVTDLYKYREEFFRTLILLATIDVMSNIFEAFVRNDLTSENIMIITLVGIIRGFTAYTIYFAWRRKELFILKQEHQKRYSQLNMLVANVESELFYLKKSAGDIERVMGKCYTLYGEAKEGESSKMELLDISKDIHEIKKDYLRVLNGFQDFVDSIQELEHLTIAEIFTIMKTNYEKVIKEHNQKIQFYYEQQGNPVMTNYLSIFTILNNLVDNSITACNGTGTIRVIYTDCGENHRLMVMDNGTGFPKEVQKLIFNPGYTTKYDPESGKASTGIGLTHVKNTVEALGGEIALESLEDIGTKFIIDIPKEERV